MAIELQSRLPRTVACFAPYGTGGLGQHFSQIIDDFAQHGVLHSFYSSRLNTNHSGINHQVDSPWLPYIFKYTHVRFDAAAKSYLTCDHFDRGVVKKLVAPVDCFVGFGGMALRSFRRALAMGCKRLELVAANSHVHNVARQHAKGIARDPIEQSWLNRAQIDKTLEEYAMAETIYVASSYTHDTFVAAGVPAGKLQRIAYDVHPRFVNATRLRRTDDVFRIVCTGSVTVMKGVPVLVDAFEKLADPKSELIFVGGTSSPGMRRYMEQARAKNARIFMQPGDPLPMLLKADVCVQPTWEDGYAYAPMEGVACGVPAIVSFDTGAKDHIRDGVNGYVVPTGDVDALVEKLRAVKKNPLHFK